MRERNAVDRMTSQDGIPLRMQWLVPVFHFPFGFHSFRYMIFISITGIAGKCTTPSFEALTILMAYYSAKAHYMNPIMELPTGKGFADVIYLPKRERNVPALVIELKWDRSAEGAIAQIKAKGCADWVKGYTGDILLVGINYDKETKGHQCRIEAMKYTE